MSQFTTACIGKSLFFPSWFCLSPPALLIFLSLIFAFSAGIQGKHCLNKVFWQNHIVSQDSWQDQGITCSRFLCYPNLCLSGRPQRKAEGMFFSSGCRKDSQRSKALGCPRATQLSLGTLTYTPITVVLETSHYFCPYRIKELPKESSYSSISSPNQCYQPSGPLQFSDPVVLGSPLRSR